MGDSTKNIYVYADWIDLNHPHFMGTLTANQIRGKEIFSFQYDDEWLKSGKAKILDPDLSLFSGFQHLRDEKLNFGMFLDSSPDRWGRVLMKRREIALAKQEERKVRTLFESDFLLGVYDPLRMGGLRFKTDKEGDFLDNNTNYATPPWTSIGELESASLQYEKGLEQNDPELLKWLNMLYAPGSSLGGARPKANIQDSDGSLWIAKFPSKNDDMNIGAWEMVANSLAIKAGINCAIGKIGKFNSRYHTYLTKRFDRDDEGKRIHFASAMTLLGYTDGTGADEGVSYLELAEFIIRHGSNVNEDLKELFRRIAFSVCISNTDDHLRNHGFLLNDKGWMLSPAYDINPNPDGTSLKLNISLDDNSLDLELVLSVSDFFRLEKEEAQMMIEQIKKVVSNWRQEAKNYQIYSSEQDRMENAFSVVGY
ncbi:type II toxin-antitoxin system HipA family toxin [Dysgonomonas sp. 511]|uniref:type II toxin-antitoxin system HipA family toxin n=1 Tax=Dysgonomonas sp. 511 TaxID=2302930 RepID=UPI001C8848C7|nr:HipA domain-containing protein [Dysgonomonas sp. 511]